VKRRFWGGPLRATPELPSFLVGNGGIHCWRHVTCAGTVTHLKGPLRVRGFFLEKAPLNAGMNYGSPGMSMS